MGRVDFALGLAALHLPKATGVPQLVAKVAAELDILFIEEHIQPQRRTAHRAKAQGVGAVLVDELERLGRVAEALGHLAPLFVANNAGVVDIAKGQLAAILVAGHYHPRDPKENDVRPRDEVGGGVKFLERVRLLRPAHRGKRPQPRAAPGVEHIGILLPALTLRRLEPAMDFLAAIPNWNPMPPP